MNRVLPHLAFAAGAALLLAACAGKPAVPWSASLESIPENRTVFDDHRGRFREVFCAVNEARGALLPDTMDCEVALHRVGDEPAGSAGAVNLDPVDTDLLFLMVPGLGWNCVEAFLDIDNSGPKHVAGLGFDARLLPVESLSGSVSNAAQIDAYLNSLPEADMARPIVLLGYSKGIADILEFFGRYPETAKRVRAVISYAGAVWGTPLVKEIEPATLNLMRHVPGAECVPGDSRARESLLPSTRSGWFDYYQLPEALHSYSVVAFPTPERISRGLVPSWHELGELQDERNDSQLVFYDQLLPGSKLLAFANADHWAMAVPVARQKRFVVATVADQNNYPREVMLEALLRFVLEDLEASDALITRSGFEN